MKNTKNPRDNPLYGVLYDNRPPTYAEVASLNEGIKTITRRVAHLREELADLEDQLHRHRSALAPVRRLPFEVLGEIFRLAVRYSLKEPPCRRGVIDLTLVCKTWRNAALAAGHLWSTISIDGPAMSDETYQQVSRWLARARGSPTSVTLWRSRNGCPCTKEAPEKCLCLNSNFFDLISKGPPIHRLGISGLATKCVVNLFKALRDLEGQGSTNAWSNLRSLELAVHQQEALYELSDQGSGSSQVALSFLPPITSLTLFVADFSEDKIQLPIPIAPSTLTRLTTLSMRCYWDSPQVAQILQHCTNVEHLTLDFERGKPSWDRYKDMIPALSKTGYIELPKVHTLILDIHAPDPAESVLTFLRFPVLSTLCLGWDCPYTCTTPVWTILNALNAFAPVNPTPIRSLNLDLHHRYSSHRRVQAEDLTKVLSDIPNLVDLSMSGEFDPISFLDCQPKGKEAADAPLLAPTLERWELVGTCDPFHLDSFLKYIKSRQKYRKQKGKIVFQEPMNRLKSIVLTGDWKDYNAKKIMRTYTKVSSTLKEVRSVFGVKVERFGFSYSHDDPVDADDDDE